MTGFILRRFLLALPVLFLVLSFTFLLMRLAPGNPFSGEREFSPSIQQALEKKYHLHGTLIEQYTHYITQVLQGDLGISTQYRNRSVNEILAQALPVSMGLGTLAFLLALTSGVLLGTWAAHFSNQPQDRLLMLLALLGISTPNFVLGPLFILLFATLLPLLPVGGWGTPSQLILPSLVLAIPFAASIARLTRSSLLEVLSQNYIRTARAKGLGEKSILFRHALKTAILPIVSYSGPLAASVLTGGIVVETIFRIPGLGPFFVNSILNRDIFMVGGTVLVYSSFLIFMNILADILYFLLDRRIALN